MSDADDQRLIQTYRAAGSELPPPALDRAILESARQAVAAPPAGNPRAHNRWLRPLALAASVVLGLGLVIRVQMERPDLAPLEAKKEVAMEAAPAAAPAPADVSPSPAASAPVAAETQKPQADRERKADQQADASAPKLKQAPGLARAPAESEPKFDLYARLPEAPGVAGTQADARRDQAVPAVPPAKAEPAKRAPPAQPAESRDKSLSADSMAAAPPAKKEKDAVVAETAPARSRLAGAGSNFGLRGTEEARIAQAPAAAPPPPPAPVAAPMPAPAAPAAQAPAQAGGGLMDMKTADAGVSGSAQQAAPAASTRNPAGGPVRALDESNPDNWARRIAELRRAGRIAEAEAELKRLRERYPDFKVPADALPPAVPPPASTPASTP